VTSFTLPRDRWVELWSLEGGANAGTSNDQNGDPRPCRGKKRMLRDRVFWERVAYAQRLGSISAVCRLNIW
jgi:hypothetical protein